MVIVTFFIWNELPLVESSKDPTLQLFAKVSNVFTRSFGNVCDDKVWMNWDLLILHVHVTRPQTNNLNVWQQIHQSYVQCDCFTSDIKNLFQSFPRLEKRTQQVTDIVTKTEYCYWCWCLYSLNSYSKSKQKWEDQVSVFHPVTETVSLKWDTLKFCSDLSLKVDCFTQMR